MTDFIWLEDENGEQHRISYDELDTDLWPQLWKPTGKFSYAAGSFLRLPLPEVPYYVKDWLPKQGKAEIYGQAKVGKSFLCLQLARCIAAGEPFLGVPTEQGRVLYLQFELGVGALQDRMIRTKQVYDDVYVGTTFSMQLDKLAGQQMLLAELDAVEPSVLILDPWYKILSGDENEAQDTEVITNFLDEVIEGYGLSVVILHHMGKDPKRGGRGSSVLEGWVDSYIELRTASRQGEVDEQGRKIHRVKLMPKLLRHAATPPEPLNLVLDNDGLEFHVGEKPLTVKDRLFQFLVKAKSARMQDAIDAGIGSRKAIYDARKQLLAKNLIEDLGDGKYKAIGVVG